ncbi:MAG TPA: caspase family protein [Methylomirabilota bacterium]
MSARRLVLAALTLALAGCAAATTGSPRNGTAAVDTSGAPLAERPTFTLGDRWIRNDGIFELIRVELDHYVFSSSTADELHLSRDLVLARYKHVGSTSLEFTPLPKLQWPLRVGSHGAVAGRFKPRYGEPYHADFAWQVAAWEDVTVPAGTFKAFRIVYRITPRLQSNFGPSQWRTALPSALTLSYWYAPEVRQFVKADGESWIVRFELVAVDPGEREPLTVRVAAPKDQSTILVGTEPILTGRASGGKGVVRVEVTVNGRLVASEAPTGEPRRNIAFTVPLALRDGKNVVIVTATEPGGAKVQEARTIFHTAPPTVRWDGGDTAIRVGQQHVVLAIPLPAGKNVSVVSVAVNDVVADSELAANARDGVVEAQVRLAEGENRVRIRYDLFNEAQIVQDRTIVYDPAAAAPVQVAGRPQRPEDTAAAEEGQRADEARRAEELRQRAEEQRLAEEQHKRAEEQRLADERKRAEEQRLAEEQRKRAEEQRVAEEQRRREEARLAALPPLVVTLSSPRDQARFEQESIGLAGTATGGKGVSRVSIALNGVEVSRQDERTPQRALALSLPVTLREGQNTLVVTATEADGTVSQEVRTVFFERPQPLTVALRFPQDQMRVSDAGSVAAAVVSSSKGVTRTVVSLNGVQIHEQSEKASPRSQLVTVPLRLQPGVNVVAVSATDAAGVNRQEVRTVFFDPPQALAASPAAPAAPAQRWAVVIGVGHYEHPSIPRLRYSVADAESVYETLVGVAGFKKEHVLLMTDKSDKKPTLKNIKWALGTFLARSAHKDDTVLIFFAGHGAPETDPRGLERDGLAKYLIPADAEEDDLYSSALPMDELHTIFNRIEAERIVAFLDACYSGAAGGRTFAARKTRAAGIDDQFLERLTRSKGRAIITASRPSEVSIELPELGHGIFTYYLVNGLKGAADLNGDGIISLQELYEYVEQQVSTKSRAVGGNQHPVMKGEMEGVLPLAKAPGR